VENTLRILILEGIFLLSTESITDSNMPEK